MIALWAGCRQSGGGARVVYPTPLPSFYSLPPPPIPNVTTKKFLDAGTVVAHVARPYVEERFP